MWGSLQVIATAQASVLDGCNAEVLGIVEAGDIRNPSTVFCNVQTITSDDSFSTNTLVEGVAESFSDAGCSGDTGAVVGIAAQVHPGALLPRDYLLLSLFYGVPGSLQA